MFINNPNLDIKHLKLFRKVNYTRKLDAYKRIEINKNFKKVYNKYV